MITSVPDAMEKRCLTCGDYHPTGKGQKRSKESTRRCEDYYTAFSKDCEKRVDEEKINRLMTTK
jgi:hypothetical protein